MEPIMVIKRTYRRMNKAIQLAHSGEADSVLAAAHEILSTRMKHGNALNSPSAVRDYLRLLLHNREHEVFSSYSWMHRTAYLQLRSYSVER